MGLWKILARLGCPPKFLTILCQLHEGQQGQVEHNVSLLGSFPISNGIKQGCVLALHCSPSSTASCSVRQKRTCHTAYTSVSKKTAVSSTFGVSSHAQKPSRNSSLSCCLLRTAPFLPTRRKPYNTLSTTSLMQQRTLALPSAWKRLRCCTNPLHVGHTVLTLPRKGNLQQCQNYWTISLISHPSKVMLKIILNWLKPQAEKIIADEQAGFRAERSTTEQIFNLHILCEKYLQHQQDLHHVFIDFKKAFDRVSFGMQLCGQPWRSTTSAPALSKSSKTSITRSLVPSSPLAA